MKFEIKSCYDASVLFSLETESLKLCVEAAVKSGAYLSGADLSGANLSRANLGGANLSGAYLGGANLSGADLSGADLGGAYLSRANLSRANLGGANLGGTNLDGANLSGANLKDAKEAEYSLAQTTIVPETGGFQGWKKCLNGVIVRLRIPAKAQRSNASGRKCRASEALVLQVIGAEEGISRYDRNTKYRKGETVKCDKWNEDRWQECGGGIHFFLTRIEAERY
jgi:hypothetical protein